MYSDKAIQVVVVRGRLLINRSNVRERFRPYRTRRANLAIYCSQPANRHAEGAGGCFAAHGIASSLRRVDNPCRDKRWQLILEAMRREIGLGHGQLGWILENRDFLEYVKLVNSSTCDFMAARPSTRCS